MKISLALVCVAVLVATAAAKVNFNTPSLEDIRIPGVSPDEDAVAKFMDHARNFAANFGATGGKHAAAISTHPKHARDAEFDSLPAACQARMIEVYEIIVEGDCYQSFQNIFGDVEAGFSPTTTALNDYCGGTCRTNLQDKLEEIVTSGDCPRYGRNFTQAVAFFKLPCIQVESDYCLPQVIDTFEALDEIDGDDSEDGFLENVNEGLLGGICNRTPCMKKFVRHVAAASGEDDGFSQFAALWSFLCMKDGGEFCLLELKNLITRGEAECPEEDDDCDFNTISSIFNEACETRCLPKIFAAVTLWDSIENEREVRDDYNDNSDDGASGSGEVEVTAQEESAAGVSFFALMGSLCTRNPDTNQLCVFSVLATADNDGDNCDEQPEENECNAACKGFINNMVDDLGCCVETFFGFIELADEADATINEEDNIASGEGAGERATVPDIRNWITETCDIEIPEACDVDGYVEFVIRVANVRLETYNEDPETVERAVKADIAAFLGVNPTDISYDTVAEFAASSEKRALGIARDASDGLEFTGTIQSGGRNHEDIASAGEDGLMNDDADVNSVNGQGAEYRNDPVEPAVVDGGSFTFVATSSAASVQATLAVIAAALIAVVVGM